MTENEDSAAVQTSESLAFFGRISASLSHELKNVLATINEYSGLLDDLAHSGKQVTNERLQGICGKVSKQVDRGQRLIQRLNRFSHTVDRRLATVDLCALLGDICDLCARFATLKQARLERAFGAAPVQHVTDPFALQFAVHQMIDVALHSAATRRLVSVALEVGDAGPRVVVHSGDPLLVDGDAGPALALLRRLARQLAAEVAWDEQRMTLTLAPSAPDR